MCCRRGCIGSAACLIAADDDTVSDSALELEVAIWYDDFHCKGKVCPDVADETSMNSPLVERVVALSPFQSASGQACSRRSEQSVGDSVPTSSSA